MDQSPRKPCIVLQKVVVALVGSLLICLGGCGSQDSPADPLTKAREALQAREFDQVRLFAGQISQESADWSEAQFLLGQAATMSGNPQKGLAYLAAIPRDGSPISLRAAQAIASAQRQQGSLEQAADAWEYLLKHRPQDFYASSQLGRLLSNCGLHVRAQPYLFEVIKSGRIEVEDLVAFSVPERGLSNVDYLHRRLLAVPEDAMTRLGVAIHEFREHNLDSAREHVRRVITSRYELAEAQALWGELCLDEELSELEHWYRQLPESAQNHAGVWFVRGQWAQRLNRNDVAARCYWECVRLDPTNRRATYQLGQTLAALGSAASEAFLLRAAQLKEIAELVERMLVTQGQDRAAFRKLVELLQQTGRDWEAWAWVALTAGPIGVADPTLPSLAQTPQPPPSAPRFRRDQDLSVLHDLSHLPNFDAVIEVPRSDASSATFGATSTVASAVHFQEEAEKLGVAFTYFQSRDPNPDVVRIFESTGGGIGVLDYDRDGWPDFYFTQGQEWPRGADRPAPTGTYRDVLFRNQVNGFVDVTRSAAFLSDMDYGQGCSCGDFNNDGFPDLYVANVGANRLYQNQGDGTFLDITLQAGIDDSAWTTSCLILDLNADGNPDLYDVNYLQGKHIYRVECAASRCSVKQYEGAPDRVWLSQGDGRFVAVSEATPQHGGKGLGVVALFLDAQPKPHLFIGNDQVPNFLLCPTATDGCYEDQALIRGLALNRNGETTASMGIAAGDINHDGRVDLLVTNFEGEANTLFLQRDQGLFEDAIIGTGLMSAGIRYVGWGAQFLDADNDGELDVIVTNGHVAEFNEPGVEYRMPTQFFHNTGRGFRQPSPAQVGAYFLQNHLGRSLALCDWNRDGLTDVLISHIGTPVAVLTNVSQPTGHWLDVFVSATKSARDAIGTVVELHQGDRVERQQLLAGDGYQVSNERKLHFGLGNRNTIDRLIVHWPSGQKSTWESVPGDRALILIEGESLATLRR